MDRRIGLVVLLPIIIVSGGLVFYGLQDVNTGDTVSFSIQDRTVDDFGYVLQYDAYQTRKGAISALTESKYDLLVMDGYYQDDAWTTEEIQTISNGTDETSTKILLCYMSIGEAEDYRQYWNESWDADHNGVPDAGAPDWLDSENPDWPGNYKVHYWDSDWQRIIFGTNDSYLDQIIAQGFDGVYLDIIDAYEFYEDQGVEQAAQLMVDFVAALSHYAKTARSDFLIVPQNGEHLATCIPEYLGYVDGIGREDVFTMDDEATSAASRNQTITDLNLFLTAGKFVLIVEYPTTAPLITECYETAQRNGFLCYVGPRDLDGLHVNAGHAPD
ncbi:MAG: endo alpha-1,4 polygalactosaminidase [Candidatus Thorarchaeota archaeon]|nr:endo alpha-1,4 polygalactosaminidase [Candidatus Thorarchaeota archaeon]